ncbi:MAG: DUF4831 family protein [Muribaculaceae bacterium]|nr:DUF4831 family protein [Muribaculaceae bacterium]
MKKLLILPLLSGIALAAPAQTVTKLSATKANDYGITYSLPRTTVDITLEARHTIATPGEFYNYTERYLGADAARKAVSKQSTSWTLISAVMNVKGEIPADAEQYLMQFKGGTPVFVTISETGLPLTINTDDAIEADAPYELPVAKPLSPSPLESKAARYAVTEEMLQSSSLAKRAQLAAEQIMQLRQSRQDYLTGQADNMPDGKALELILSNINAQEEALTAMFIGTVRTSTDVTTLTYIPPVSSVHDQIIARLNPLKGFVAPDDLSGAPIYLNYTVNNRGKLPMTDKGVEKTFPRGGVPYCIPGSATFTIDFDGHTVDTETFDVAQLGVVFGLEPSFFTNKKEPGYAIFNPLTGALREFGTK